MSGTMAASRPIEPASRSGAGRDHGCIEAHSRSVAAGTTNLNGDQRKAEAHSRGELVQWESASEDADSLLLVLAEALDDIESTRIANQNRLRSLEAMMGAHQQADAALAAIVARMLEDEKAITKALEAAMAAHPLGPWVKRTSGLGLKQIARLLATIGDPYIRAPEYDDDGNETAPARPRRGPAELWAYCGYSPTQRRQKGLRDNWSADAKMRAHLIAAQTIKFDGKPDKNGRVLTASPYRAVYDAARAQYADAVHPTHCVRCGPSGSPALPGSPLSAAHQHARAVRRVAKAILKDLYVEARALHQRTSDTHRSTVQGA